MSTRRSLGVARTPRQNPAASPLVLANRLTGRDLRVLGLLLEHRVLTTPQIADVAYRSAVTAAHRMLALHRLGVADRFRPCVAAGSAPWHWIIADAGAAVLAGRKGVAIGYRRAGVEAVAFSRQLGHLVGCNGLFTALAAAARDGDGRELAVWWSEWTCARQWGDVVRPDGYGRWREDGRRVDFFAEWDTGTETTGRVAAKLTAYTRLAEVTGISDTRILLCLPTARRETSVRRTAGHPPVSAATATHADIAAHGPHGQIWLPLGTDRRHRLADLPAAPAGVTVRRL